MDFIITNSMIIPFVLFTAGILISFIPTLHESLAIKFLKRSSIASAACAVISTLYLTRFPSKTISIWVKSGIGISIQQDSLSLILLTMICILGMSILSFSINYLDGEDQKLIFIRRIAVTTLCAMILVSSGNLALLFAAWVGKSLSLNKLFLYYKDRARAHIPALKKNILSRISDTFLLLAFWKLYTFFGTAQLSEIYSIASRPEFNIGQIQIAGIFLVLAACFKSAQFPLHGWLVEVMESPTPVSALLHAGILNAGPFLILRFAYIFASNGTPSLILIIIGGLTALYASTVLLTQSAIKTMLGYSSAAHMGFTLFLCGTGAYSAALLHLIGHSFYKAYTFLSSGSAVKTAVSIGYSSKFDLSKINSILGLCLGSLVYTLVLFGFGYSVQNQPFWSIGYIVILGISLLIASGIGKELLTKRLVIIVTVSAAICAIFFSLEHWIHQINKFTLPFGFQNSPTILMAYTIFITIYLGVVWFQSAGIQIKRNTILHTFYVHLRNGFYVNYIFDRLIGTYSLLHRKGK